MGTAKLRFWPAITVATETPTLPVEFSTGPPLEPGLIGALI